MPKLMANRMRYGNMALMAAFIRFAIFFLFLCVLNKIKSNVQADFISIRPALVFNLFDEIVAKRKA